MRALSAKSNGRAQWTRAVAMVEAIAALAAAFAGVSAKAARAADASQISQIVVKVGGKLPVPSTTPIGVIATDPVLQQVLSEDFQVAGRLAGAGATSELTLTVTLTHRTLEPGMSLNDVAPGNDDAVALLKQAGVKPQPLLEQVAPANQNGESDEDADTAAEGNPQAKSDVNSYQRQGQTDESSGMTGPPMMPMTQWPVPPAVAQQRSAIPPYMQPYRRTSRSGETRGAGDASAIYDTIFIARATAGSQGGGLTVVAVAHPGFNPHEARKLIAEEIANSVLH
jgi:hypothetical protein